MEIKEFVDILEAIASDRYVAFNYQLQRDGCIHALIESLGGPHSAHAFFVNVMESEPAVFEEPHEPTT